MSRSRRSNRPRRRFLIVAGALMVVGALVVGGMLAFPGWRWGGPGGPLTAARTFHDFGRVRMGDGLLAATFPLTVRASTTVTGVGTT